MKSRIDDIIKKIIYLNIHISSKLLNFLLYIFVTYFNIKNLVFYFLIKFK